MRSHPDMLRTSHKFHNVWISLEENDLSMFRVPLFEFLLEITTAMLIFAKPIDFALQLLQLYVCEASSFCL